MSQILQLPAGQSFASRLVITGVLGIAGMIAFSTAAQAVTESVIHVFSGADGNDPIGGLIADKKGKLYGTTYAGGASNFGAVFMLKPPATAGAAWVETTLLSLNGTSDGANPQAALLSDATGALYGTAYTGGGAALAGTIFKLTPPAIAGGAWTNTVLYSFAGPDGKSPRGPLIADLKGVLYGTTQLGGTSKAGTVFSLTPPIGGTGPWTEQVLYSFTGAADGANPKAGLLAGKNGVLYGTVTAGGASGFGAVFMLTPPATAGGAWTETILHSFTGGSDGANPVGGLIVDKKGVLYGTTSGSSLGADADTVFKLKPPAVAGGAWTETILYTFAGGADGANPVATLAINSKTGILYGTTLHGGPVAGSFGTAFQLTPPAVAGGAWTKTALHGFMGVTDGANPTAGLTIGKAGALFGATNRGGSTMSAGTVFEITP